MFATEISTATNWVDVLTFIEVTILFIVLLIVRR